MDLDKLSKINSNMSATNSLSNEIKHLTNPNLSGYKDLFGLNPALDSISKINELTSIASLHSMIEQSALTSITNVDARLANLLGKTATDLITQNSYISEITDAYRSNGLDQASVMSDVLLKVNGLSDVYLSDYQTSLLKNTFDLPIYNEVDLLNEKLADLTRTTGVEQLSSASKLIDSYLYEEANQLTKGIRDIYGVDVDNLLKQEQVKLNELYSDVTLKSAFDDARKFTELSENPIKHLFDSMPNSTLNNILGNSVLSIAGIKSKQFKSILDSSLYGGVAELEELVRQSTLNAFEVFESYYVESNTAFNVNDETLREIKESLSQSSKTANLQFYISIIITLLVLLYSVQASIDAENRDIQRVKELKSSIDAIETTMATQCFVLNQQLTSMDERLRKIESSEQSDTIEYVVIRTVNLRTKSNTNKDSQIITLLLPNQKVELLKRKGKWIYVGYFDYIEDIPKTGWVAKKYLKMIK